MNNATFKKIGQEWCLFKFVKTAIGTAKNCLVFYLLDDPEV